MFSLDEILERRKDEYGDSSDENEDEVSSIADSVRSNTSIRSVQSKKSVSALVSKMKEQIKAMEPIYEEPVQVTHTDDDGRRLAETKNLNKLPFKNRNPAL